MYNGFMKSHSPTAPLIALAPDSFKGAIDAAGVADALADGISRALPRARFRKIPMADGGEGTVAAWAAASIASISFWTDWASSSSSCWRMRSL